MNKIKLDKMAAIICRLSLGRNGKGLIIALIPRIKKTLKILDPITLPTAMSGFFL